MKAILVLRSVDFPRTHDLAVLAQVLPAELSLGVDIAELVVLNRYGVEARYPGDWEPITRLDADQTVAIARRIREAVRQLLPAETTEGD